MSISVLVMFHWRSCKMKDHSNLIREQNLFGDIKQYYAGSELL